MFSCRFSVLQKTLLRSILEGGRGIDGTAAATSHNLWCEAMCVLLEDIRVLEVPEVLYLNQVR